MKIPSAKPSKKFIAFLAISAIIGSVIYIYSGLNVAKAYSFFAPINDFIREKIVEPVKKSVVSGETSVGNKIKQATASLTDINTAEIKNNVFSTVKSGMDNSINAIGKLIGADINQQQNNQIENNQSQQSNKNCSQK